MQHISLFELQQKIKDSLIEAFPLPVWITAEISEIKVNYAGHCYIDLVEKESADGLKVKAKASANIWANKFRLIKVYFERTSGVALSEGLKILVKADVRFHEVYGYSLNIVDIDPAYTIGEMKLQRNLIVQQLMDEGIIDLNKELEFPIVPQRIAAISSASAAGYQDFYNQLLGNSNGYGFHVELFQAVMQGNEAENSIVDALNRINLRLSEFDVVAIIRGGGSQTDLVCFDSYNLSANVAQFPLPVLAGIGHDKDESIVDLVAYSTFKTPTAVAAFLVETVTEFDGEVSHLSSDIVRIAQRLLGEKKVNLSMLEYGFSDRYKHALNKEAFFVSNMANRLLQSVTGRISRSRSQVEGIMYATEVAAGTRFKSNLNLLDNISSKVASLSAMKMMAAEHEIDNFEVRVNSVNPKEMLRKGYSLTLHNGRIVKDLSGLKGEMIETILDSGILMSEVKEVEIKKYESNG